MSITVRLWTEEELNLVHTGKDKFLSTIFMNGHTFSQNEIRYYPYHLRNTYICSWWNLTGDNKLEEENTTIYATDKHNLKKFLNAEYARLPDYVVQEITEYKVIPL